MLGLVVGRDTGNPGFNQVPAAWSTGEPRIPGSRGGIPWWVQGKALRFGLNAGDAGGAEGAYVRKNLILNRTLSPASGQNLPNCTPRNSLFSISLSTHE